MADVRFRSSVADMAAFLVDAMNPAALPAAGAAGADLPTVQVRRGQRPRGCLFASLFICLLVCSF